MNKFYLILLSFFLFSFVNAQELCSTATEMNSITRQLLEDGIKSRTTSVYLVRVYFHVIRKTDGSGASMVQNNVQIAFNTLNNDFNPHGIYFIWDNTVDFINNSSYYNYPGTNIYSVNNHTDGIDIYLYGDDVCEGGMANGIANSTEYYIGGYISSFPSLFLSGTHVVSHEMGHVLGLYHTHHGTYWGESNSSTCAEFVNGSNSDVCGDYIEDTPADPFLAFNVDPNTGQWLGSGAIDPNGDMYQPDTHLIMSYTHPLCMSYFSTKQGERMRYAISQVPVLQSTVISLGDIVGSKLISNSSFYYVSGLPTGLDVAWSLSDNYYNQNCLQQNYPSTNQCTISYSQVYNMMNATLTAYLKFNGDTIQTLTKAGLYSYTDFWGQYTSGNLSGYINYSHYLPSTPNSYTYIFSPNFYGGTASYNSMGTIPSYWQFYPDLGRLYFTMPTNNNNIPVVIDVYDGCGNYYQLFAIPNNSPYLNVSNDGACIIIALNRNGDVSQYIDIAQPWTIEIRNASTGMLKATKIETSRSASVSTAGWSKGVYIIKATVGDKILTEKFVLK